MAPHLVLVDDDPAAIRAMRAILADYPNQRFATTGPAALSLVRAQIPDLIVLDLHLPGMTGLEVCDEIRSDPQLRHIPVIVATSGESSELEVAALEHGAVDFVKKPLQPQQFRARIRAHLAVRSNARPQSAEQAAPAPTPITHTGTPRMLIVDDDVGAIHLLRCTLDDLGDVHFATGGPEALALAEAIRPDLILLDAHMPGTDGFEVCRHLKALPTTRTVPIVFVTRFADAQHEERALDLGAADFVSKPYAPAVLRARVRNLLELKHRHDADMRATSEHWRRLSDARVSEIVRAASDAIVCVGSDGSIALANIAAGKLFGVEQESLIGLPLNRFLLDEAVSSPGHAEVVAATVRQAGGQPVSVEVSASQAVEGGEPVTVVILRDVSWRAELEAHERARAAAEAAHMAKSRMLSFVAHEMGNPLNAVLGCVQLMRADTQSGLSSQQRRWLDLLTAGSQSLQTLLQDLLDMGRRESAAFATEVAAVNALAAAETAAASVASLAARAGVDLRLVCPEPATMLMADPRRLQQCLVNLITNAVKYNARGGWVEVRIDRDAACTTIAVQDNGIGMDQQARSRLFRAFDRLGQEGQSATAGTGLGLLITRQLLESMHGELDVISECGVGSCFTIRLPREPDPRPQAH